MTNTYEQGPLDDETGAVTGLHSVARWAPQIVADLACSTVFGIAKLVGRQNETVRVLRIGIGVALGAAYWSYYFADDMM